MLISVDAFPKARYLISYRMAMLISMAMTKAARKRTTARTLKGKRKMTAKNKRSRMMMTTRTEQRTMAV